jgi:hypothetical protein
MVSETDCIPVDQGVAMLVEANFRVCTQAAGCQIWACVVIVTMTFTYLPSSYHISMYKQHDRT